MSSNSRTARTEAALETVADTRRRRIVQHLIDGDDEAVTVDELVAAMTDEDAAAPEHGGDAETRTRIALYHVHLPKLAEANVIEYDPRSGSVRYRDDAPVESLVRFVSDGLTAR